MDHQQLKLIIQSLSDNLATPEEQLKARLHLDQCDECRREFDLTQQISRSMKIGVFPSLGDVFTARIMANIQKDQQFSFSYMIRWFFPVPALAAIFLFFNSASLTSLVSVDEVIISDSGDWAPTIDELFVQEGE